MKLFSSRNKQKGKDDNLKLLIPILLITITLCIYLLSITPEVTTEQHTPEMIDTYDPKIVYYFY